LCHNLIDLFVSNKKSDAGFVVHDYFFLPQPVAASLPYSDSIPRPAAARQTVKTMQSY